MFNGGLDKSIWQKKEEAAKTYLAVVEALYPKNENIKIVEQFYVLMEGVAYYSSNEEKINTINHLIADIEGVMTGKVNDISDIYKKQFTDSEMKEIIDLLVKERDRLQIILDRKTEEARVAKQTKEEEEIISLGDRILDTNPGDDNHPYTTLAGKKKYINYYGHKLGETFHLEDGDWLAYTYNQGINDFNEFHAGITLIRPADYTELEELNKLRESDPIGWSKKFEEFERQKREKKELSQDQLKSLKLSHLNSTI